MSYSVTTAFAASASLIAVPLAAQNSQPPAAPSIALDHVVFAVNDLESAAARFRSFGFALKPGRPHDNGIRNEHVKFKDGTELELLTAPAARDELTTTYRRHLTAGDGPAFLALMARPAAPPRSDAPAYIFFGGRNASPTDRPEHFEHANTAESLIAVWLAGADFSRERALLARYGAVALDRRRQVLDVDATVLRVHDGGAIYLLPARARLRPDRPIVGVTFRTRDVATAARVLKQAGVAVATTSDGSLLLSPMVTGGLWIELATGRAGSSGGSACPERSRGGFEPPHELRQANRDPCGASQPEAPSEAPHDCRSSIAVPLIADCGSPFADSRIVIDSRILYR